MKLPYYMIEFSAAACLFEIRVNDNPVVTLNLRGQVSSRIPINHAISQSGKQEVSVSILPLLGESKLTSGTELYYDIKTFDVHKEFDLKEELEGFKSNKVDEDKIVPFIKNISYFTADIPYTLKDLWENGENIEDVDDFSSRLRGQYDQLGNQIKNGNFNYYLKAIQNRELNISSAMYLSSKESKARINRVLNDLENGFNEMFLAENAVPIISAYGKKVSLKKPNGEPALIFVNREKKEQLMLDIEFYYNKENNDFEII